MRAAAKRPPRRSYPKRSVALMFILSVVIGGRGHTQEGMVTPQATVRFQEAADCVHMANDLVALRLDKTNGVLLSFMHQGRELLAAGGGYVQIAYTSRKDKPGTRWEYRLVRQAPDLVEIAFVNVSPACPFDFASHFILRAGESGFHHYLTWGHDVTRSPRVLKLAQYNLALRIDPALFTTAAADDARIAPFPPAALLTPKESVMDSTYALADGGHYSKYFFASERDARHPVHGAMGTDIGMWVIMPSQEHLNGGPEHQELTVHQAGASQVLLAHAQGAHYGAGILTSDPAQGSWQKVSAPWFIYVNRRPTHQQLWDDAKQVAAAAVAAWPYPWLDDATFQRTRGHVTGRLTTDTGEALGGAHVVLADHEAKPGPLLWQQQWRGYRYAALTDAVGRFDLPQVRDGTYDVYAWHTSSFGWHRHPGIRVSGGARIELGTLVWQRRPLRSTLWQIGVPDRSAQEFGFAHNFRQWGLWHQIATALPAGATYVVGQSTVRDWPFLMAVTQQTDRSWLAPTWNIRFTTSERLSGQAALSLGIACYEGKHKPQLEIRLNGDLLGSIADLEISGAVHRSGIHAGYQERELLFAAERVRVGDNTLTITMPPPNRREERTVMTPAGGLMWDCLRLAVLP